MKEFGHTQYPERYRRLDNTWCSYELRPATPIGFDLSKVLGTDGVIIAALNGSDGTYYWLDPDCSMLDEPDVTHYIWLCDQWQEFVIRNFRPNRIRSDKDIEQSFAAIASGN